MTPRCSRTDYRHSLDAPEAEERYRWAAHAGQRRTARWERINREVALPEISGSTACAPLFGCIFRNRFSSSISRRKPSLAMGRLRLALKAHIRRLTALKLFIQEYEARWNQVTAERRRTRARSRSEGRALAQLTEEEFYSQFRCAIPRSPG